MSKKTKKPPNEAVKGNNKHLTLDDRIFIEKSLDAGDNFKVAYHLHKSHPPSQERYEAGLKAAPKNTFNYGSGCSSPPLIAVSMLQSVYSNKTMTGICL